MVVSEQLVEGGIRETEGSSDTFISRKPEGIPYSVQTQFSHHLQTNHATPTALPHTVPHSTIALSERIFVLAIALAGVIGCCRKLFSSFNEFSHVCTLRKLAKNSGGLGRDTSPHRF